MRASLGNGWRVRNELEGSPHTSRRRSSQVGLGDELLYTGMLTSLGLGLLVKNGLSTRASQSWRLSSGAAASLTLSEILVSSGGPCRRQNNFLILSGMALSSCFVGPRDRFGQRQGAQRTCGRIIRGTPETYVPQSRHIVAALPQYEFVVWIAKVLKAPSLTPVWVTVFQDTSQARSTPPADAMRHQNVSEPMIAMLKVSSGAEFGFISFPVAAFPNVKHLDLSFGDTQAVFKCPVLNGRLRLWRGINSLKLTEELAFLHDDDRYGARWETFMAFVQARPTSRVITIDGPICMKRPLTAQIIG